MEFTYKIVNVDKESATMEILYEREGYPSYTIGIDKPRKDETLSQVIKRNAPFVEWELEDAEYADVEAGISGTLTDAPEPSPEGPFEGVEKDFLNDLPTVSAAAVDLLMTMELKNLMLQRVFNRKASLVGLEITGPLDSADTIEGSRMFRSATKVIEKAGDVGVTVLAKTNNPTSVEFLEDDNGFERLEIAEDFYLFSQPRTSRVGKKIVYSSLEFMELFKEQEVDDIMEVAESDKTVRKFYDQVLSANFVDKTDPRVSEGIAYLVTVEILTQPRADEIMMLA